MELKEYQKDFIDFLIKEGALLFGEFITKSGRHTPYFINTGEFCSGHSLWKLGEFYASHIVENQLDRATALFGPAYKGIPLSVVTSCALFKNHGVDIGVCFDRKEIKDHGEEGGLIGCGLSDGDKVVIVEDVITAGTTLRKIVPFLREVADIDILGVVLSVDRAERGQGKKAALKEISEELEVGIYPIVDIHMIVSYLQSGCNKAVSLSAGIMERIESYLEQYGAR